MSRAKLNSLQEEIEALKNLVYLLLQKNTDEEWLDSAEIKIRFHFSESKLYRLRKEKKIPFIKIGGRYHYPKTALNEFLYSKL
jgi:excisionase family DNA binding protein